MDDIEKQYGTSSIPFQALGIISYPFVDLNLSNSPEMLKLGQIWWFFVSCDLEILRMTLINDKTIGHFFYAHSSFVLHSVAIVEFQFELQSGNGQIGFWHLWPWPLTSDFEFLHGRHFCHW